MFSTRHFSTLIAAFLLLLLAACQSLQPEPRGAALRALVTSPNDEREYATLLLPNQLRVLVVSDPETDKSAAALAVFYGSYEDPLERPGLAHFLEHMLFLGTEDFPQPDEYQQFISTHGGSNNAYTAGDHTNYFFDVAPEHLEPALHRFSQFFTAPLFTAEYVEREMNAVDSEYNLRLKDDAWRTYAVQRQVYNPDHPASRFNIGTLETLANRPDDPVREDLLRFYERHYSANRMALVIVGRESTDVLADWARVYFSDVPNRGVAPADYEIPLFREGQLPQRLQIQPVKENYEISWAFPVPGFDQYYLESPANYIGNILGHEGEGSLHSVLKELGWIESLAAGAGRITDSDAMVEISIELTEEGRAHQLEIGDLLFRYIALIRESGVTRWLYDEQRTVAHLAFDFQEKQSPQQYVYTTASNYLLYPPQHVLYGPYAMDDYDAALIRDYLGYLRPENVVVTQTSPDAETDATDPWFDVPFSLTALPEAWVVRWQDALTAGSGEGPSADLATGLAIVAPNPFLPESLALVQEENRTDAPEQLTGMAHATAWLVTDTEFKVPRASVQLRLESPLVYRSAADAALAELFRRLVNDELNAYAYAAHLAGLGYRIAIDERGLRVSLSGYSDKQPVLLERILTTLDELAIDPEKFERYRQEILRELRNTRQNPPYQQAMEELSNVLLDPYWSVAAREAAVGDVTPDQLRAWKEQFLASLRLEGFFHGNLTADGARAIVASVEARLLGGAPARPPVPRGALVKLDDHGYVRSVTVDHSDSATVLYLQGREQGYGPRAAYGLMVQLLSAPYFNDIRTERQLGYLVAATTRMLVETPGILFIVQSPVAGATRVVEDTRDFAHAFVARLDAMPDEEFEQNKRALINSLLQKDQNLRERSARLWGDFDNGVLTFDSREQIAAEVETLSKERMSALLERLLSDLAERYLLVYAPGQFDAVSEGEAIAEPAAFKAERGRFTHPADDR